ncbi:MAG: phosphatase PAP2 family protein [Paludibacteraceae bacterium]|nr:phosphatase PAP2 family protein [Paludibacteraceae bacterium]
MIDRLIALDQQILLAVNGWNSPFADVFMWIVSSTVVWIPFFGVLLWAILKNKQREGLLAILMIILVILACDQIASSVFKPIFERLRPTHDPFTGPLVHIVNDYRGGKFGFVSSHAANTFGFALFTSLLLRDKFYTATAFIFALLSSYSRMYLGVHFLGDILGGFVVGVACASLLYALYRYLQQYVFRFRITFLNPSFSASGYARQDIQKVVWTFGVTLVFIALISLRIKNI